MSLLPEVLYYWWVVALKHFLFPVQPHTATARCRWTNGRHQSANLALGGTVLGRPGLQIVQALFIQSQVQSFEHLVECPLTTPAPKLLIHR